MTAICLCFRVHQPFQLKQYGFKDIDVLHSYADEESDRVAINRLADDSYLPANATMLSLIKKHVGKFKISYSISGTVLELLQLYRPDVIASFRELVGSGYVEILGETYYNSLSFLYSKREFKRQVEKHAALVFRIFGVVPRVFRNTELIYNNELASYMKELGFKGALCEGAECILQGRSCNYVYAAPFVSDFGLLLRHVSLSDDIAFRFDDPSWNQIPLTAEKYAGWIHEHSPSIRVINICMNYETFGVHKTNQTGIFDFLQALPTAMLGNPDFTFNTPSGVLKENGTTDTYDVPHTISWENKSGEDNILWNSNMMQHNSLKKIYSLEKIILTLGSPELVEVWGKLQTADYFYYMGHEKFDGHRYKYVNPFSSAEEIYEFYTNIVTDFELSMIKKHIANNKNKIHL